MTEPRPIIVAAPMATGARLVAEPVPRKVSIGPYALGFAAANAVAITAVTLAGPFPYIEIVILFLGAIVFSFASIFFAWRGFLLKARVSALMIIVLPGLLLTAYLTRGYPNLNDSVMALLLIEVVLLAAGSAFIVTVAYPKREPGAKKRGIPKTLVGPVFIADWEDPITNQSSGKDGRRFPIYGCPNIEGHDGELFYLSLPSWIAKNFLCPVCREAITDEWRPKPAAGEMNPYLEPPTGSR